MDDAKLRLAPTEALAVSARDVRALTDAGDGDAALLYLHILLHGGTLDPAGAATALHRSDREIEKTVRRLRGMGLLSAGPARPLAEARELPQFETRDVVRRTKDDGRFAELVDAVQLELGRKLSSPDLNKLFGIYDTLALPADVIYILVKFCKNEHTARYGPGKNLSMGYIEKVAYTWSDNEIVTPEQAEQWVERRERRKSELGRLQSALGLGGRALTATERRYLEEWLDLGFGEEAILIAADRTVTNTNGLKWKYADSIIRSWHGMGLHTPAQIEAGDKKPPRGGRSVPAAAAPPREDDKALAQLERLREKMKSE